MSKRIRNLLLTTTSLLAIGAVPVMAGPDGGKVVGGGATITGDGTNHVIINQTTQNAIINWMTFNLSPSEWAQFLQPNSNSIVLNRVIGGEGPSVIDGKLTANGRVFLVNRDGMLFGPHAAVNTASFLATTADIKNKDFMAGRMNFNIRGRADASIVNEGRITAQAGGFAALVAPGVRNTGTITATLGTVAMSSGNTFALDFYGDKLIRLGVTDFIASQVRDVKTGQTLKSLVSNEGTLSANGGRVELTAVAARAVVDSVINNTGVIEANSVGSHKGMIVLGAATAKTKGNTSVKQTVKLSGRISAAGKTKGSKGGTVVVTGEDIAVKNARIDASGSAGGGKVLIGGDWGGGNPLTKLINNVSARLEDFLVATATNVSVDGASVINASARDSGNGGKVILWSNSLTTFAGSILARGAGSGSGGFVETSGKTLQLSGTVNGGKHGLWLIDPSDLNIDSTAAASIMATLNIGTDVIEKTPPNGEGNGNINVRASIAWHTDATLTLSSYNNINIYGGVVIANTGFANGNLVLRADNTGRGSGTVRFLSGYCDCASPPPPGMVDFTQSGGKVSIYYNPDSYTSPTDFSHWVQTANPNQLTSYMLVNSVDDLRLINTNLNGTYALGKSFDASGFSGFGSGTTFSGLLDGNGGLGVNYAIDKLSTMLFGFVGSSGVVRNLNLTNVNISATQNIQFLGALAGENDGTINHVNVTGTINGLSFQGIGAGGVVGQNRGTIAESSAAVDITLASSTTGSQTNFAGGLVGSNLGTISHSHANGDITVGTNGSAGGLAGQNGLNGQGGGFGTIVDSWATGNVTLTDGTGSTAGGLVGVNWRGLIDNSHATGNVSGGSTDIFRAANIGGLVGMNVDQATITGSYASGDVTGGSAASAGGLVGFNFGFITGSHASGAVSTTDNFAGGLVGFNSNTGTIIGSFASGNVTGGGISMGGLAGVNQGLVNTSHATGDVTGNGSGTIGGLVGQNDGGTISHAYANGNVSGGDNVGGLVGDNTGLIKHAFATGAVGGSDHAFIGGLVGNNAGTIFDTHASGAVNGQGSSYVGGLVGRNESDGGIGFSYATGIVTLSNGISGLAGGLVGDNRGTIDHVYATGNVSGGGFSSTGGLAGSNEGTITLSYATGDVSGGFGIGGLVGTNQGGTIDGSHATGAVSGSGAAFVGGLVGQNDSGGTITASYASGIVTLSNGTSGLVGGLVGDNVGSIADSHATGKVTGSGGSDTGGLAGSNDGVITASYATGDVSGGFGIGGLIGFNNSNASISDSHASGAVEGGIGSSTGGLVGINLASITNSYATGNVTDGLFVGGLVGANSGSIGGSHATGAVASTNAAAQIGGLAGVNTGDIGQSYASGNVTGGNTSFAGGFVGTNTGEITKSHASGNVTVGNTSFAGGFAAIAGGTISESHATGDVAGGNTSVAGGFAAAGAGSITKSYAHGDVTGGNTSIVGGFIGLNTGSINQAFADGDVTGGNSSFVGGFAGANVGSISQAYALGATTGGQNSFDAAFAALNLGSIDQVYGAGLVTGGAGSITGGLVAANSGSLSPAFGSFAVTAASTQGTVTNAYWDRQTTGQETSAGGTAFDSKELANGLPPGFDPTVWSSGNGSYPFLTFNPSDTTIGHQVLTEKTQNNKTDTLTSENQQLIVKEIKDTTLVVNAIGEVVNTQAIVQQQQQQQPQQRRPQQTAGTSRIPGQLDVGPGRYFFVPPPGETRLVKDEVVLQLPCNVDQQALDTVTQRIRLTISGSQCLGDAGVALYRMHIEGGRTIESVIRALAAYRIIAAAQANYTYQLMQEPDLSGASREGDAAQYVLDKWRLPQVHRTLKGENVTIGVIDSEVDVSHPDLEGAVSERYDATGAEDKPHPHGTGMAGAIASHKRLMGIAPAAKIVAIRAFSSGASAESTTFNILKGLDWAVNNKIRIVNMSFAGPRDPSLERAIKSAHDKGVVLIAAAGNAGPKSPPLYPAADPNVIAVTATDIDDKLFKGANRGRHIAVSAPGVDILVPAPEGAYQMTTGTSVATAHISGIVALLLERNPRLAPEDIRKILAASAKRLGPNNEFGAGLVDPIKAIELAAPKTSEVAPAATTR